MSGEQGAWKWAGVRRCPSASITRSQSLVRQNDMISLVPGEDPGSGACVVTGNFVTDR
jgi:hypothetical protein